MQEQAEPETLDQLVGDWSVYQLRRGHRFSTDDLVVAWTASQARPQARRYLDIGAGIGSVSLMTLWGLPADATLVMVEVQEISHALAKRSIAHNGLEARVTARLGDLRDPASVPEQGHYELVTGSPPYIPLGHGVVSPHPQRAGARMELKGDVYDYCRTAARALAPGGFFAFVHAASDPRPEPAVAEAGLQLLWRQDVVFRAGQAPTIAVFACAWEGERADREPVVVRDAEGHITPQYEQIRREVGAPPLVSRRRKLGRPV